jgi:hypothetical protein
MSQVGSRLVLWGKRGVPRIMTKVYTFVAASRTMFVGGNFQRGEYDNHRRFRLRNRCLLIIDDFWSDVRDFCAHFVREDLQTRHNAEAPGNKGAKNFLLARQLKSPLCHCVPGPLRYTCTCACTAL